VQHIDHFSEAHRINRPKSVAIVSSNDLQDARPAESLQRLRIVVLFALLGTE
jgi:hypothetical protein